MALRILNRSFSGGEITPELFGRLDLSKVQEALALCRNFITLPHGPVVNRPGTEFIKEVQASANATRLIPFSYNNTQAFAVELGAGYVRWHAQAATLAYTAPAAYGAGTTYNQGDMCSSGGTNYYCIATTTGNAPPNATYWYAMPADLTYEIPNPYAAADLMDIHYTQSADVLTLVHPNYPIMELRRYGATNWRLVPVSFGPLIAAPAGGGATGTAITHTYAVLAVGYTLLAGGSSPTIVEFITALSASSTCTNDITQTGAYNVVTWGSVPMATVYLVYKQSGGVFYFLGSTSGLSFRDDPSKTLSTQSPLTPQFNTNSLYGLISPPGAVTATAYAASGGATSLTASATGTGSVSYSYVATALDESGNESGPSNTATCTNDLTVAGNHNTLTVPSVAGAIRYNIYRLSYGAWGFVGQLAPPASGAMSFVDNNITPDISRTAPMIPANTLNTPGAYPAAVTYYQGRRFFGGTSNQPQNIWATRSGTETDLSYTIPSRDDNRLAFRIAGREASAIRHIVPLQDLLFLSASCEWKCSSSTGVLTPATLNVQPQSYIGANNVQPVVVGNAVLYAAARGGHMRQMGYNWQINGYQSTDISIFAPHLFDYNTIVDMAYSRGPVPILWCVSSSGKLLGMTWLPEQQISAWHQHDTGNGDAFESICTISENNEDMLYCIVRRTINGVTKRYVERLHTRLYATLADAHYVDCGISYTAPVKSGTYALSGTTLTCTIANHGLSNGSTYWFAFSDSAYGAMPGGQPYTVTVLDANTFTLQATAAASASGTVTWLPHTASGLTWLEGMTVNILADGAVLPQQVVTGGTVTFPVGVSVAHIGLPIAAQLQTPPAAQSIDPAMAQGMAKNINKVFLRTYRSSGILAGPDFTRLVPCRQRSTENPGAPPNMVSDEVEIVLDAAWGASGQVCIQQS
ncbi:MAG TPA: hypothetical protein VLV87_09135, partial [Gammaproteobacteria bacterium]|nr:hypothetical protein [Gammaproteobacteria bacterium]